MTARSWPVRSIDKDNEVVRRIYVKSSTDRSRNPSNYHHIKVGVAQGSSKVDWLGEWKQASQALVANERFYLTGADELNYQLDDGDEIVVWHDSIGSPSSAAGLTVEVKGSRLGAVGAPDIERRDGSFPSAARPSAQLFSVGSGSQDIGVEVLASELNESGVGDWGHVFSIPDASSGVVFHYAADDYDETDQTINSGTFVDGNVSVTVALPVGVSSASVQAVASATGKTGSKTYHIAVGDGTTDHNDIEFQTTAGLRGSFSTTFAGTITETTTFTARFHDNGGNATISRQAISVLAIGLYD